MHRTVRTGADEQEEVSRRVWLGVVLVSLGAGLIVYDLATSGVVPTLLPAIGGIGWIAIGTNLLRKRRS